MAQPPSRTSADTTQPGSFEPEVFGKYFLVDRIAVGGMAEIFKAKTFSHGGFEKLLVIKRILSHLSENDEFLEMFVDEARVSATLQHANIVQTYDFGKIHKNCFIAMECVEGKDAKGLLRKLAQRRKLLPIEFAVYIAHEVAKGLDYAHRKQDAQGQPLGLVHRDMSPSNALISYEGEVKIADFGIAKASTNTYTTKDGVLKGKFEYMSPEQAAGQDIDHRSDVFALGIILYECLTGRRLFKAASEVKTLEAIKACRIDPPSVHNPAIPARLDEIVMRALARSPADRYQDAREFQNDLLEFLYPATPDLTRQSFAHFLRDVFAEEIAQERKRLEEGTRRAAQINDEAAEVDLEFADTEPGTLRTKGSRISILLVLVVMVMLLAGLAWVIFRPGEAPAPPPAPALVPLTGTASVELEVPARVLVDGALAGDGTQVEVTGLAPGIHALRVEAAGYQPRETTFTVEAGDRLRLAERLDRVRAPPREPEARPAEAPSAAEAPEAPSAAEVPEAPSAAEAREAPSAAEAREAPSAAPAEAAPPATGRISINVSKGWATIWIDGKRLTETTPLANHALAAGDHSVHVENGALGIDETRQVTILPGETARVFIKVE